jgi:hypothetical protein
MTTWKFYQKPRRDGDKPVATAKSLKEMATATTKLRKKLGGGNFVVITQRNGGTK